MPLQEDYQISLDAFHGPLDLLLYLIRRAEVDVHDIPIAKIADQYFEFLKQISEIDIDVAGEFIVMAATLVELKSRTLMPPSKNGDDDAAGEGGGSGAESRPGGTDLSDPRYELVQQLLAYQRYRIASDELEQRRVAFSMQYPRRPARIEPAAAATRHRAVDRPEHAWPGGVEEAGQDQIQEVAAQPPRHEIIEIELDDAHLLDLAEAYERIMESIDFGRLGDHKVEIDDTPIALHQEDLLDRLQRAPEHRLLLQDAFAGANPGQRIGLFLATLELVRLRRVVVSQDEIEGEIELTLNENTGEALVIESDEIAHYGEALDA